MLDWLDGKKTYIVSALGALATIAGAFGFGDIATQLTDGQAAVQTAGWVDDVKWLAGFLALIFMRVGIAKRR